MSLLDILGRGIHDLESAVGNAVHPQQQQQAPAQQSPALFSHAEDGAPVMTPRGIMPLSSVQAGGLWRGFPQQSPGLSVSPTTGLPALPNYPQEQAYGGGGLRGLQPQANPDFMHLDAGVPFQGSSQSSVQAPSDTSYLLRGLLSRR